MFINTKNINKARLSVKLDYLNIRPYKIKEVLLLLVCKLELPVLIRI